MDRKQYTSHKGASISPKKHAVRKKKEKCPAQTNGARSHHENWKYLFLRSFCYKSRLFNFVLYLKYFIGNNSMSSMWNSEFSRTIPILDIVSTIVDNLSATPSAYQLSKSADTSSNTGLLCDRKKTFLFFFSAACRSSASTNVFTLLSCFFSHSFFTL